MYNILMVHPLFPSTYWGFQEALYLVDKKASLPPLGLLTLASLLPEGCRPRLCDLNIESLRDDDLMWADVVFIGGMLIQIESMQQTMERAHALGRPVVVGGPTATTNPGVFKDADVVFQGEAEGNIEPLMAAVEDLVRRDGTLGRKQVVIPAAARRPDMSETRVPRFDLLDMKQYSSMSIQYSRGCPFHCEFCDIVEMFGNKSRVKSAGQILDELDEVRRLGFKGSIFFVDDNFIGNKREVRRLLPRLSAWQRANGSPFDFYTEASVNLAADHELMRQMVESGFRAVFVGIESPSKEALKEAGKSQNLNIDLTEAVDVMTRAGLEVMGGFIVGFDQDGPEIFDEQRKFIQSNPIPLAMAGLLMALPGTALWRRLDREGRLRGQPEGDQFGRANFVPSMDEEVLLRKYRSLMHDIYSPKAYYRRCERYVDRTGPIPNTGSEGLGDLKNLLKIMLKIGIQSPRRFRFWRLLLRTLKSAPHTLKWAVIHALQGEHMIKYTEEHVLPRLDRAIAALTAERRSSELAASLA